VSRTLLADAQGTRLYALQPGPPAAVHVLDFRTAATLAVVPLPAETFLGTWLCDPQRTIAYVLGRAASGSFFVERFDLASEACLGSLAVGAGDATHFTDAESVPGGVLLAFHREDWCSAAGSLSLVAELSGGPSVTTLPVGGNTRFWPEPGAGLIAVTSKSQTCMPGVGIGLSRIGSPAGPYGWYGGFCCFDSVKIVRPSPAGLWAVTWDFDLRGATTASYDRLRFWSFAGEDWSTIDLADQPDIGFLEWADTPFGELVCAATGEQHQPPYYVVRPRLHVVDAETGSISTLPIRPGPRSLRVISP
jgi:hypothetical protein